MRVFFWLLFVYVQLGIGVVSFPGVGRSLCASSLYKLSLFLKNDREKNPNWRICPSPLTKHLSVNIHPHWAYHRPRSAMTALILIHSSLPPLKILHYYVPCLSEGYHIGFFLVPIYFFFHIVCLYGTALGPTLSCLHTTIWPNIQLCF